MTESELIAKAGQLTSEISWVTEYYQRWDRICRLCKAQLNMCEENKKGDKHAIDALNVIIALSQTKADKCKAWLSEKQPELDRLMTVVNPQ